MNHKQAARTFLTWFETNVPLGAISFPAAHSDYLTHYRDTEGKVFTSLAYVSRLARERLDASSAAKVSDEAYKLLHPEAFPEL